MKQILTLLLLLMTGFILCADETIVDIEKALILAKENNITLKREIIALENRKISLDTAYNVFYPSVSGMATLAESNTEPEYEGVSPTNLLLEYSASFNFTPALFDAVTLLKRDYELGEITYEEVEKQIELNIKKIFYSIIFLEEQINVLEESLATVKARYDLTKLNYDAGLVSELELLQVEVSYKNFLPELHNLKNIYNNTKLNFKNLLGLELDKELILTGDLEIDKVTLSFDGAFERAKRENNNLNLISKSLELLEAQKKAEFSRGFLPIINVQYKSGTILNDALDLDKYEVDNFSDDNGAFSLSLLYSFTPLLPNSPERVKLKKLDRSVMDVELQQREFLDNLKLNITHLLATLNNSIEIQQGLKLTVDLSKRMLEMTENSYKRGTSQLLEVDNANNEYNKARLELLREQINYYNAYIELESLIGEID